MMKTRKIGVIALLLAAITLSVGASTTFASHTNQGYTPNTPTPLATIATPPVTLTPVTHTNTHTGSRTAAQSAVNLAKSLLGKAKACIQRYGRAACKATIARAEQAAQRATVLAKRAKIHVNFAALPSTGYGGMAPQAGNVSVVAGSPASVQFASTARSTTQRPVALPATGGAAH